MPEMAKCPFGVRLLMCRPVAVFGYGDPLVRWQNSQDRGIIGTRWKRNSFSYSEIGSPQSPTESCAPRIAEVAFNNLVCSVPSMAGPGAPPPMPSASEPELLAVNTHAEKIRVLTFNRPQKRNALSQALMDKFLYELAIASRDARVRAIVVTGGKSFFSGPWLEYLTP
ncbi:enoyl-CoA hydratase [Ilyonectria robusta]